MQKKPMIGVTAVAVALGTGAGAVALGVRSDASAASTVVVAPYVDLSANSSTVLTDAIGAGLTDYTAAFVTGSGCTPIWGDTLSPGSSTVDATIAAARRAGAEPIISFGGAAGTELAVSCTSTDDLVSAYRTVVDTYDVDRIDFDVEGAAIADTASVQRRFAAIARLQAAHPDLQVSVTIPVMQDGPDGHGTAFLAAAAASDAEIDLVNVMAMDYGQGEQDMGGAARTAAEGTLAAARTAGLDLDLSGIGITPMIGVNDTQEVFTEADAEELVTWAEGAGVGRLSFWSVGRDRPCEGGGVSAGCSGLGGTALDFTKIFLTAADGGSGQAPTSTSPTTTAGPTATATVTDPATSTTSTTTSSGATTWAAGTAYAVGDEVVHEGVTYRCRQAHTALSDWVPPAVPALWLAL